MDVYASDAPLDMHEHHAGNGGWGKFYVDMERSITENAGFPSFPPLRPGVLTHGSSDNPIGAEGFLTAVRERPLVHLHGTLMILAFVILFPAGVLAMRTRSTKSFQRHWIIQALATLLQVVGGATGLAMSQDKSLPSSHQRFGVVIVVAVLAQGVFGWLHHVRFRKVQRRTAISYVHIWLGRIIVLGGWSNALSGLSLSGHGRTAFAALIAVVVLQVGVLVGSWIWTVRMRTTRPVPETNEAELSSSQKQGEEQCFALGDSDSEDDQDIASRGLQRDN
ncbi:hypothetical protein F4859DRAFT_463760 [Xylaria cf. heliscus]|nr:hypothetical protein F4859DRAFT_463760 [Xylaria cf. heliscus]